MNNEKLIELRSVSKSYDGETILRSIDLDIHEHEFITLLGPSGCGKTTTLRIIGGFVTPDEGKVYFDGKLINDIPPHKRPVNTVFQRYALFPHLNVFENIAFGLRIKKTPEEEIKTKVQSFGLEKAAEACGVGVPTLMDIVDELLKPGRDPRDELPPVLLRQDVLEIKDLKPGMVLTGTVRNVIDFGVFVDIGVHQDGLVHISQVANRRLKHPSEVVQIGDVVKVMVLDVDEKRHRISLTMKGVPKNSANL